MEPFVSATALATVVSLIGQFISERRASGQANFNDFMVWLAETNHDELKNLLESNVRTTISLKAILNEQHENILERLRTIDQVLAAVAGGVPGFGELSQALKPEAVLSKQALSILQQFEFSGSSKALMVEDGDGLELLLFSGNTSNIEFEDERFVEDDLRTLVELGLLRQDYNSSGKSIFLFTRAASELVRGGRGGLKLEAHQNQEPNK